MTKSLTDEILTMYEDDFSYQEIANHLGISRNSVAGKIWRYNNPGMWKKGVPQGRNKNA